MCTGLEIAAIVGAVASTAVAADTLTKPGPPKPPPAPQAAAAPQAEQTPDQGGIRQGGASAMPGGPGAGATFLSGLGGVSPGSLNLGKSTLLGQ